MLVSSRTPKRRRCPAAAAAMAALLVLASGACSADEAPPERPASTPTAEPTPLADYDTSAVTVVRATFCDRVTDGAVAAAVDSDSSEEQSWQPGGRLPDSGAIGNEFGCAWTAGPVTARAWVFAPPVTRDRAEDFASESVGLKCKPLRSAPPLGDPGVAQSCTLNTGATLVGIYGLVGDAWVSCEISGRGGEDVDQVGEWCVAVLEAVREN